MATGAAYAHLGAMPMILITGQKAIKSSAQARFQIVDMVATMKPLTKFSRQIVSVSSIPTVVRDAFRTAADERPGPVHLELPEDSYVVVLVRGERALPARPETRLVNGDKLLAVTSSEHEAELRTLLIGE